MIRMQQIHAKNVFSLFVPLALPAHFTVAALKAPFGFAVNDEKTLNYYQYCTQLYYFNKEKNEEEEAVNCFAWGKGNPLSIHYNPVTQGIDGVTLHLKINHYIFDFRRLKERVVRITVACLSSSQAILHRGSSAYLQLVSKKYKESDEEDLTAAPVVVSWITNEDNVNAIASTPNIHLSSEESSSNDIHYSSESPHNDQFSGSNESDLFDYQENAVDASPETVEYPIVPRTNEHYMVLCNGNAEVVGNFRALNFYKASDKNIKEDIRLLSDDFDCRDVLLRIDGVDYKFKPGIHANVNRRFVGYIAQQVESVVPEAVQLIDGILHVDYESLIPYLSESIRQNFNDIKNIKADNEKLQQALDSIYAAFIDKKRDSSVITPFTEAKPAKTVSLPWRILIVSVAVITALVAVAAVVVFFTVKSDNTPNVQPTLPLKSNEQIALEHLYNSTNGEYWLRAGSWLTNFSMCEWEGITCRQGSVIRISLNENNLNGTIPAEIHHLVNLQYLNIGGNSLYGTIPDTITSLTKLQLLNISSNAIEGTLPQDLGFLTELTELNCTSNMISGTVPKSLASLQGLQVLHLGNNQLHGIVLESISALVNLTDIYLNHNYFTGTISEDIGKMAKLKYFDLSDNQIEGTLPSSLGGLTDLRTLNVASNLISGNIPEEIWMNPSLLSLNVSSNSLRGTIPNVSLGTKFKYLDVSSNALYGTLPEDIFYQAGSFEINLSSNAFTGTITDFFKGDIAIKVDISYNQFTGAVPNALFRNQNLRYLYLNNNNFTETLPAIDLRNLRELHAQHNQLQGPIPSISDSGFWEQLDLSFNEFEGPVTNVPSSLNVLLLNNNKLNGTLDVLTYCYFVEVLDVSSNYFIGGMPRSGSDALQYLNASHNMLTEIEAIPDIKECDMSFNSFKCPLPNGADRCRATCV